MTDSTPEPTSEIPESPFEQIKRMDSDGNEFWSARDLISLLGYSSWQRLDRVFEEIYSSFSLENPWQTEIQHSFIEVEIGSGAVRKVKDWHVSRLAIERVMSRIASHKPVLIRELRQNNDARFRIELQIGAILTEYCNSAGLHIEHQKRLENRLFDYCIEDRLLVEIDEAAHTYSDRQIEIDALKNRLAERYGYKLLRIRLPIESTAIICGMVAKILNQKQEDVFYWQVYTLTSKVDKMKLNPLAPRGVVTPQDFAIFQNHGYKGLYNGLTAADIHRRKKLKPSQHILDHMGTTELAANLFRSTQAEEKLRRDNVRGKDAANEVHYQAGIVVRRAIAELGGTMPEELPTADSIKKLESAEKKRLAPPKGKKQ